MDEPTAEDPTDNADDHGSTPHGNGHHESGAGGELASRGGDDAPLLYRDLDAPQPTDPDPPPLARWLAFAAILVGGLLGGLIGYGTADIMSSGSAVWAAGGGLAGAAIGAVGVGIVASLTLRAMNEWNAVEHPEAESDIRASSGLTRRRP